MLRLTPASGAPSHALKKATFVTSARPASQIQHKSRPVRASNRASRNVSFVRRQSTASAATNEASPATAPKQLTWNRFLELRRTRRKISVVASSISSIATAYAGLRVFMQGGYDATLAASLGLDPLITAGLSTTSFLAVGWLIGPFFGNAAFNTRYSSIRKEIEEKERAFYARIKAHRVDPTSSSMANPVPDYYGEKIGSVADYRRWLKDQRAFNLKRGAYQGTKLDNMHYPADGTKRTALFLGLWAVDVMQKEERADKIAKK